MTDYPRLMAAFDRHVAVMMDLRSALDHHEPHLHTSNGTTVVGSTFPTTPVAHVTSDPITLRDDMPLDTKHNIIAEAYARQHTLPRVQAACTRLEASARQTLLDLLTEIAAGPVHHHTSMRTRITSSVDEWGILRMRVACADHNHTHIPTTMGELSLQTCADNARHLVCAAALGLGIDTGPTWRIHYSPTNHPSILHHGGYVDVQASTQTRALEWAALLHHNNLLDDPSTHTMIGRLEPVGDLTTLRNDALNSYAGIES